MKMNAERQRRILQDMASYCTAISTVVRRGRDEFFDTGDFRNRVTIEHYLELLGEASEAVGQSFRTAHSELPWAEMKRFRFDSAHPYDDLAQPVNHEEIWRFASVDLPRITRQLRKLKVPAVSNH